MRKPLPIILHLPLKQPQIPHQLINIILKPIMIEITITLAVNTIADARVAALLLVIRRFVILGQHDRVLELADCERQVAAKSLDFELKSSVGRAQFFDFESQGADLDVRDGAGFLHCALHFGDLALVVFQLVAGAVRFVAFAGRGCVDGQLKRFDRFLHLHDLGVAFGS